VRYGQYSGRYTEATQSATLCTLCTLCSLRSLHQVATLAAIRTRLVTCTRVGAGDRLSWELRTGMRSRSHATY
jgi:hypothetical protein